MVGVQSISNEIVFKLKKIKQNYETILSENSHLYFQLENELSFKNIEKLLCDKFKMSSPDNRDVFYVKIDGDDP
ncbi:MAG: hypothetical protein LBJ09_00320 [Clostridiales bacterium]|nr:hypothetical protein [Clostridiales bacterium]